MNGLPKPKFQGRYPAPPSTYESDATEFGHSPSANKVLELSVPEIPSGEATGAGEDKIKGPRKVVESLLCVTAVPYRSVVFNSEQR